jgi:hypothetical protein
MAKVWDKNHLTILIQHVWLHLAGAAGATLVYKFIRNISRRHERCKACPLDGEHVSKFRLSDAADPRDGVRLIKAFLEIEEPALRGKLICLAEDLAKASSGCLGTAQGEESHRRGFRGFDILATPVED